MGIRRYNPISDKRLAVLRRQARKALERQAKREVYELRQSSPDVLQEVIDNRFSVMEQRWTELQTKLPYLGAADPTPSGSYSKWVLDLLLKKNIDLPEDAGKVRELLEHYHRVKQRLPLDQRQLKAFTSYQHLRSVLLPLLPELRSRAEMQREGTILIAEEEISAATYEILRLATVEATTLAAKNSGWCVCNPQTAARYLESGPLFLILRDGKRHALCHIDYDDKKREFDPDSIQVMNFDDIPVYPDHKEDYYPDLVELFVKHLPMFLCPDHTDFKDTSDTPLWRRVTIFNLECEQCDHYGCYRDLKLCVGDENERCHGAACLDCVDVCASCNQHACSDHNNHCCQTLCDKCVSYCAQCEDAVCTACGIHVDCCNKLVCATHSEHCQECNNVYCDDHYDSEACRVCQDYSCGSCAKNWPEPDCCDNKLCDSCYDHRSETCDDCMGTTCPDHITDCDASGCDKRLCYAHAYTCDKCGSYDYYCEEHHESAECPVCLKEEGWATHHAHTHAFNLCGVVVNKKLSVRCNDPVCEDHAVQCHACEVVICDKHQEPCDCPSLRDWAGRVFLPERKPHQYCPQCIAHNICPVCNLTVCNPDDHMWCAYQRRRNPDEDWRRIEREYLIDPTPHNYIRLQNARVKGGLQNYQHYCQDCQFLGTDDEHDYYHCTPHVSSGGSLIARYGNVDLEYMSWPADILVPRIIAYQNATHGYTAPPPVARRVYELAIERGTLEQ